MSGDSLNDTQISLSADEAEELDRLCDRFEAAWRSGESLHFEDHLGESVGAFRIALRAELMAIELEWRRRLSDPSPRSDRFPPDGRRSASRSTIASPITNEGSSDAPTGDFGTRLDDEARDFLARLARTGPVPGYEVMEELGRGGMGVVYKARQRSLNRVVALKVILGQHRVGSRELIRFLAEAEAVASINHPHVVQVFAYGDDEGRPYLAMEYLAGGSLVDRLERDDRIEPIVAAELVLTLARAVQAAHDQGIVHRDLKPANVLFDAEGGLKITDFGLAKRKTGSDITRTHAVMGTPAYMAPEQARGDTKFVGPQADVYSLGVILYECLAGVRPLDSPDTLELLRKVAEQDPTSPSKHVPGLARDLELITLKCLAKDPAERYPTAGVLADDLARFVAGEPVSVRAAGGFERTLKWARRKPTLAATYALATAVVVLLGFGSSLAVLWKDADRERTRAVQAREVAETARDGENRARALAETARDGEKKARETLARVEYGRTIQVALQHWRENDVAAGITLLEGTRADLRGWEWEYVNHLCHSELLAFQAHGDAVLWASFSPDGSRIVSAGVDQTARVWDSRTGVEALKLKGHTDLVLSAEFSPDGSRLLTSSRDGTARVWDATTGAEILALKGHVGRINSAAFSGDGLRVVTSGEDRVARIWDATTGVPTLTLRGHSKSLNSATFSPDGSRVATASNDGTARIWDAKTGAEIRSCPMLEDYVYTVAFSPDGLKIVTTGDNGKARVWDATTGVETLTLRGHLGAVYSAVFSPDGSRIVSAGQDKTARVWDAQSGSEILLLRGHTGLVSTANFSRDGTRIVTASDDETARVWDSTRGAEPLLLDGQENSLDAASFSPDGSRVVTAGQEMARIWDARTGGEILTFPGKADNANSAAFSPDGTRIVTGDADRLARIWDANSGSEIVTLKGHTDWLSTASFAPDGSRIVTASNDKTARIWNAVSGSEILTLKGHSECVWTGCFSPDGSKVVTASSDRTARVWDSTTGAEVLLLKGSTDWVKSAAFSPDGRQVVTGGDDQMVRVWDAGSGAEILTLRGHSQRVNSVEFSPNGLRIVSSSDDGTVRLWDATSGAEVLALKVSGDCVSSAEFSPDDSRIVAASEDNKARICDTRPIARR